MKNAQFVIGSKNVSFALPVANMIDAEGQLTNKAYVAITEVVEGNTPIGITVRAPHNKKENIDEAETVVYFLNQEVEHLRGQKLSNKGEVNDMVIIKEGVSISVDEVLYAMEMKGLVIGGECETAKGGFGIVHKFEANANDGLIVHVDIDGKVGRYKSKDVSGVQDEASIAAEATGLAVPEEADTLDQDVRAMVESFVDEEGKEVELTAEEQFNAKEAERNASRAAWMANRNEKASAVAGSDAAQAILDLASKLLPAAKSQASAPAPKAAATPTKNQTNGGNVQMTNNNQTRGTQATQTRGAVDRPTQGVAGGTTSTRPAASRGAAAQAPARGAAGTVKVNVPSRGNVGTAAKQNTGRKTLGLKKDAMVSMDRGAWYMDAARFPEVISGDVFEATRVNLALGITDAKMYDAEDYAARFNREANESDLAVMEIFFGKVSFEFRIRMSMREDARSPWYCGNIQFVEGRNGGGKWMYTVARRTDAVAIAVDEKGQIREATAKEIEANQHIMVGGKSWKNNETVYGINMGEEIIAQVMRWARFGWEAANGTQV